MIILLLSRIKTANFFLFATEILICHTKSERARRAQSQQKVRARQQNKERQARGLAMKKRAVHATASDLERILRQPLKGSLQLWKVVARNGFEVGNFGVLQIADCISYI